LFAKGSIELQRRSALAVPVNAVRVDQALPYVLAVVDGKVAVKTVSLGARGEVAAGAVRESVVELTSGLAAGSTVLRGTVGQLRDGTPVNMLAEGASSASASAASAR